MQELRLNLQPQGIHDRQSIQIAQFGNNPFSVYFRVVIELQAAQPHRIDMMDFLKLFDHRSSLEKTFDAIFFRCNNHIGDFVVVSDVRNIFIICIRIYLNPSFVDSEKGGRGS